MLEGMENIKIYSRVNLSKMMDHNEEEVNELMKIFIDMAPSMLDDLKDYAHSNNWQMCSGVAHKLKSSMRLWAIDSLDEDVVFIEANSENPLYHEVVFEKINNLRDKLLVVIDQMKLEVGS